MSSRGSEASGIQIPIHTIRNKINIIWRNNFLKSLKCGYLSVRSQSATPLIPVLRRERQRQAELWEFEASLSYTVSSRTTWSSLHREILSQKQKSPDLQVRLSEVQTVAPVCLFLGYASGLSYTTELPWSSLVCSAVPVPHHSRS